MKKVKKVSQLYFNKDHEMVRKSIAEFVKKEIIPNVDEWEEKGMVPLHDLFKKMGDLGFLGLRYDTKYGGQGLDYWYDTIFLEEIGRIPSGGVSIGIYAHTHTATPAISEFGSEYLKETYLKPAISGEMVSAIAVTEPGAGSDVAALSTRAVKEGDKYILNGSKTFITNGVQADFLTLLARTSDNPGYHSYGLFVVPTNLPGFQVSKKLDKLGFRASDTAELFFDNMEIPVENLIGEEGEGFIYQMKQFQHERFVCLPLAYVSVKEIIDETVEYIKGRVVFGKPLISKQVLRHRIADWMARAEALKALCYHVVNMKMNGLDATQEISMGKLLGTELHLEVATGCLQMFGGMGLMNEMPISRAYRDTRVYTIAGGASEVMKDLIFKGGGY